MIDLPASAETVAARVFNIPLGLSFVDALAGGLLAETDGDGLALARYRLLLPTRRAARAMQEAFLRAAQGRPLLLPKLTPLGDIDEAELLLTGESELADSLALDLPPAMTSLRRLTLLAALVSQAGRARGAEPSPEQAMGLARELARLIDQVETEGLSFDRLAELAPADFAKHWQETIEFLKIASTFWPKIERAEGAIGPAARRNRLLDAQTQSWAKSPSADPVIAAGSTGTIPATARLLRQVARMANGRLLLAGLDRSLDSQAWREVQLDPGHPQHALAKLLSFLEIEREAVADWPPPPPTAKLGDPAMLDPAILRRIAFLGEALLPAKLTDRWAGAKPAGARERLLADLRGAKRETDDRKAFEIGFGRIDCATPQEEALTIALALREAAEERGLTAALVTPDRALAGRVAAELRRWSIEIDDSAGSSLIETPPGAFLALLAEAAAAEAAPVALLALLKHPLAAGGGAPGLFRARLRRLERALLRGPRPAAGLAGLRAALAAELASPTNRSVRPPGLDWFDRLAHCLAPIFDGVAQPKILPAALIAAHLQAAEALAASDREAGPARLWSGEAGAAAARLMMEWRAALADQLPIAGRDYPALFADLARQQAVRPRYGRHPRLFIWGALEARLQQADLLILGGLNEGIWPAEPAIDPWMSMEMRARFGLAPAERRIGQSAQDFLQACAAPRVICTRAIKVDGQPTQPARWLTRIDACLESYGDKRNPIGGLALAVPLPYRDWAHQLDRPAAVKPQPRPAPRPPGELRPRRLSVTEIGDWRLDPYVIYARHILKLKPLEPIDAPPEAAERGSAIHRALELFIARHPHRLPARAYDELLECGRQAFGALLDRPSVWTFWWPRFERIAAWFLERRKEELPDIVRSFAEPRGELELARPGGSFVLGGKADRFDLLKSGGLRLIDYKTGAPPSWEAVIRGDAPQLPLEAAMAEAGAFKALSGLKTVEIAELAFWQLKGGSAGGAIKPLTKSAPADLAVAARDGLERLIDAFDRPETSYPAQPRGRAAPGSGDYAHLARVKEWSAGGEGGE